MKNLILVSFLFVWSASLSLVSAGPHICQKKNVNIHGSFNMDDQRVILETHKNVQNVTILSASGINGAEVSEFSELSLGDISNGEMKEISLNVSYPEEQSFVILRVNYIIGNNDIDEILTISIGELSQGQKEKRKKRIKTLSNGAKVHLFTP